jgi:MATE family multidrug resistance protein
MAIVFGSAVRGAGDTRFSLLLSATCSIALLLAPTFAVWYWFGGNVYLCWSVCTVFVIVLGIGFFWRFQAGHWMTMQVIENEAEEVLPEESAASVAGLAAEHST